MSAATLLSFWFFSLMFVMTPGADWAYAITAAVYRISEAGQVSALGRLVPVYPHGFVMQQTDGKSIYSDSLPWWLFDMRPQGYLGRAYASRFSATLGLPANPEHWDDAEVIRSLLAHGTDAIGNLVIGEQARDQFLAMQAPVAIDRGPINSPIIPKATSPPITPERMISIGRSAPKRINIGRTKLSMVATTQLHTSSTVPQVVSPLQ